MPLDDKASLSVLTCPLSNRDALRHTWRRMSSSSREAVHIAGLVDLRLIRLWVLVLVFGGHFVQIASLLVFLSWTTIRFPKELRASPVPNTTKPLPIRCPKCQHNGSTLVVKSLTVMSVTCANCGHFWATDLESLPPEIQEKIPDALRDR
jgi:hypothetical protein